MSEYTAKPGALMATGIDDAADPQGRMTAEVPPALAGSRLDVALAKLFPEFSRSRLQAWVRDGRVRLDGRLPRVRERVTGGELIALEAVFEAEERWTAEPLPLAIVFEDDALLVVNKPAGLVTHPGTGNRHGTLLNALLNHAPELAILPRAGLIHRLDKETSGLLVVARTPQAHQQLVAALARREIKREYDAIAYGSFTGGGTIDAPVGRHPRDRLRMAVTRGGRPSVTHYRVIERFAGYTRLRVNLETGRTHQIRVHLAHIRHPLVGDAVYGGRRRVAAGLAAELRAYLVGFPRQALHAARLVFEHPVDGREVVCEAPLPGELAELLERLRATGDAS